MKSFSSVRRAVFPAIGSLALSLALSGTASAQSTITWTSTGGATAWLTGGNWGGGVIPGVSQASDTSNSKTFDVAQFGTVANRPTENGINMNTGSGVNPVGAFGLGAFSLTSGRTTNYLAGNSATGKDGILYLNGTTTTANINGVTGTIISNFAANRSTFTLQNFQGSNTPRRNMTLRLGGASASATFTIQAGAGDASTYGNEVALNVQIDEVNAGSSLALLGGGTSAINGGTLTLNPVTQTGANGLTPTPGTNSFTGGITIGKADGTDAGRVRLVHTGALPTTGNVIINANSQLRLEATSGTYGSNSQTVTVRGVGTITDSGAICYAPTGTGNSAALASNIVLGSNAVLSASSGNTLTLAGSISGTFHFEKQDAGTIVLTGSNAYSGGTTINGGTLQIGNGGTTGSVAGDIVNNGALTFDRSDSASVIGAITGVGTVIQQGAGATVLSGANTYSGDTQINNGTLEVNGSIGAGSLSVPTTSGTVSVKSGGTLTGTGQIRGGNGATGAISVQANGTIAPGATGSSAPATLAATSLTWNNGGILSFDLSNIANRGLLAASDRIDVATFLNGATTGGLYQFDFKGTGANNNIYTLLTFGAGQTDFQLADFSYTNLSAATPGMVGRFLFNSQSNALLFQTFAAPEPGSLGMALLGIGLFGFARRNRTK